MDKENEKAKAEKDEKEEKKAAPKKKTTAKPKVAKKEESKEEKANENVEKEAEKEITKEEKAEETVAKEEKTNQVKEEVKQEEKKEEPKFENIPSKKSATSNKAFIIIGIVAVLVIAIVALIFYFVKGMTVSADKVFKNLLNSYEEQILSNSDMDNAKSIKSTMNLDMDLRLNDASEAQEIVNIINDMKLSMNAEMDLEKNNMAYNITANVGEEQLLNVDAYLLENAMYAKLNGILDKYIKLDLEEEGGIKIDYGTMYDSEVVIIKSFMSAMNDSLKPEYFTTDKTEDGTKNTLVLNDSNAKAIIKYIASTLKNDKKFVAEFAKLYQISEDEIVSSITELEAEIDNEAIFEDKQSIEISIFTKKLSNKITRVNVSLIEDTKTVSDMSFKVISDNQIDYEISSSEEKIIGSIVVEDVSKTAVNAVVTFNYVDNFEFTVKIGYDYTKDKSSNIELPDFSNAIKLEEMSNSDAAQMLTNIQNNETLVSIVQEFSKLIPSGGDDDDYDYDDDEDFDDDEDYDDDDEKELTTEVNQLKENGYIVTFGVPKGYALDEEYSEDSYKFFELEDVEDEEEIEVYVNMTMENAEDYFEGVEKTKEYKVNDDTNFYKNVKMSEIKEEKFGDNVIKYVRLTYDAGTSLKYDTIYAIYEIDKDYSYTIEIEALDTKIPSSVFEKFATIEVKKESSKR